ncbi:RNase H domain-containing protein [Trichonephila clavipes]|nr:RNase H domain-containing protein [Trichonephila clavipes]
MQRKIDELFCLFHDNYVHVACLQETKLNPNLNLKIKGYTDLWRDRTKSPGGGLAFLIKTPTIQYIEVLLSHTGSTNSETESRAIKLDLPVDTIKILNAYHPDTSETDIYIIKEKDLCSSPSDLKIILESSQSLHSKRREKNICVPYWRDHNIDELIRERYVARHDLEKNNSDENLRNLIDISRKVEDDAKGGCAVSAGQIASNFTRALIPIWTVLDIYLTRTNIANSNGIIVLSDCRSAVEAMKEGKMRLAHEINSLLFSIGALGKSCTLQWIPAHVDIEGNEMTHTDSLANETETLEPLTSSTRVFDAN